MLLSGNSRLHRRLDGLARAIELKLSRADDPGQRMSIRERKDLKNILSIMWICGMGCGIREKWHAFSVNQT